MKKVRFFQSIHLKFVLTYILLIMVAMQIIGMYFVNQLEERLLTSFTTSLKDRVTILNYSVKQELTKDRSKDDKSPQGQRTVQQDLEQLLVTEFEKENITVKVINPNGIILGTSDAENQEIVDQRTTDLSINRIILGNPIQEEKLDPKTNERVQIMTSLIKNDNDETIGILYVSASMKEVYDQLKQINLIFATGTMIAIAITVAIGILLARAITRPISDIRKQALEMAKGNFSRKVKVYGNDEIGQLSLAFNNLSKKLQQAHASTEGERRKLTSVLAHMTDGVIATDRKGRIILLNDPAEEMLNVSRETALNEFILSILDLEDKEGYSLESLFNEPDDVLLDFSTRNKPYILRASFSVIQKETGKINGLIIVLYDVTEQEKIEQERREFVANVSHELRTPLTTMRSYLEALGDGAWKDENLAPNFLAVTQEETERMIRLVNDLLQLSKLDATDYRLMKEFVNFTDFFNRIIDRFEMSKEQNVVFNRKFSKQARFVEIDEDKVTQVLYNIISNALKYSPEGGTITYRLKERGNMLEVSISDQGVGIPKDNLLKIFDRFYRVDKARTRKLGGTGLGLAIAKEMIHAHGGRIWATSEEGKGTTIYFTLPMESVQEDEWI
ncbi:cell wall metabolism sensor histidine kinase WalK [Priestia taiwanensis]|uniref:histidine kinase n=1 Tax=Priestia taiwanensis TaxID=1347902 RepID=A0A917ERQ5_9BACI|nr:cell wall metabolism sensor histidine kinase WalK [Priestia taiwanensis]MBM7364867.1 two-component system sensor histidine kinase VicK [Priestia taiwanensis]GGE83054.1 PAS domain-containing sensor histidine kinase [Priestia taiwanensis]